MKTRSKSKLSTTWKPDLSRHPNRPTVEELMAMSDKDFRAWIWEIGLGPRIERALKDLDASA